MLKLLIINLDAERCDGRTDVGADRNLWVKVTKKKELLTRLCTVGSAESPASGNRI